MESHERGRHVIGLRELTTVDLRDLLLRRNAITAEIRRRGHTRAATSIEGELMERAVANAYGGQLTPMNNKSVDVILSDSRTIQVKTRSLAGGDLRFWSFRDFDFDIAVVISMDRDSAEIIFAREIGPSEMQEHAAETKTGTYRLRMNKACGLGVDVSEKLREAYAALD